MVYILLQLLDEIMQGSSDAHFLPPLTIVLFFFYKCPCLPLDCLGRWVNDCQVVGNMSLN